MMDRIEWRNVWSKSATRVGYDHDSTSFLAEWKRTGRISAYGPDFPYEEFEKASKSVSVGNMIREEIAPKYQHRYLK
jgi:hypothetical protein